ncbi:hypothetical protein [Gordonia sp. KTR9]|uniref:hypothetical protein n=1 Tax=Gordonia sp. KTR9 TaxID=337191 RepID=UPI000312EFA9|nr:hypothetical protein [Gordonia sp. KTR9]
MGRRTHSAEAAWTPQIAYQVRHELMDHVHERRRVVNKRLDALEAEAGQVAEVLDDADDGLVVLGPEEYAEREVALEEVHGLFALAGWWSGQLAVTVLELADAPVHWITAPAVEVITGVRDGESDVAGAVLDPHVLSTLGDAGIALFEKSAGRHRSPAGLSASDHADVGIDGLCWRRATLGEEDAPPVVDMVVVHVLTHDRKLRRAASIDGCRPEVVDVDSFSVPVDRESTAGGRNRRSVRVLTRLAEELGRGMLTVSSNGMTDRSSVAIAVVS